MGWICFEGSLQGRGCLFLIKQRVKTGIMKSSLMTTTNLQLHDTLSSFLGKAELITTLLQHFVFVKQETKVFVFLFFKTSTLSTQTNFRIY